MNTKNNKTTWIKYALTAVAAIILLVTGLEFTNNGSRDNGVTNSNIKARKEISKVYNEPKEKASEDLRKNPKANFDLKLRDPNGNIVPLSDLKGKVIFMNLWATWCPPCVAEMPSINELHQEMGDEVAFVMLSLDRDFKKAVSFKKEKNYQLPIYTAASQLPSMYRSSAIPVTYVIDADGNLALTHKGMGSYNTNKFKNFLKGLK